MSSHKAHMLTHSDVFNFPCTECDKKFKQGKQPQTKLLNAYALWLEYKLIYDH